MRLLINLTTSELKEIDSLAKQRFENAKKNSRQYSWGNKPAPKTHKRDVLGLSGEWVIKKFLEKYNYKILDDSTRDVQSRKSKDDKWDFVFEDKNGNKHSLEVKTTKTLFHAHLLIPRHRKKYASDIYCLVKKLNRNTYEVCGFINKDKAFKFYNKERASPCFETHEDLLQKLERMI
jgi:hypothetical protein